MHPAVFPHSVFMCFMWFSKYMVVTSAKSINSLMLFVIFVILIIANICCYQWWWWWWCCSSSSSGGGGGGGISIKFSVVGVVTTLKDWAVGVLSQQEQEIYPFSNTLSGVNTTSHSIDTGVSFWGWSGKGVQLTNRLHSVLRLKMGRVTLLSPNIPKSYHYYYYYYYYYYYLQPLYRVFTITYQKQTMFLSYVPLQLFCSFNLWHKLHLMLNVV